MNQSEHNFQDLKRLLKLKRHEVPPPGYFHNFSGDVIARIKAGDNRESISFMETLQERVPWLFNLVRLFETKPGVVGGLATSLCVLMVFGLVLTENSDNGTAPSTAFDVPSQPASQSSQMASASSASGSSSAPSPLLASSGGIAMSTNPVTSLQPIFGQATSGSMFQPVGFAPGN
jgi:hypothetical protein